MIEIAFDEVPGSVPGLDEAVASPARRDVLRPEVARALDAAPGTRLLGALQALMGAELTAREWVEVAVGWRRMQSYVEGAQLAAVAQLDRVMASGPDSPARRRGAVPTTRAAADELAPALGIAPQAASRLVGLARRADGELPAAADALVEGVMDPTQFRLLAATTSGMPDAAARRVEALAVRIARRCTARQLRARLAEEAAVADPAFAARQAARAREERDVGLRPSPVPGCRRLVADLPMLDAVGCWQAVDGVATAAKDRGVRPDGAPEHRTQGQLRADALTGLLTGGLRAGDGPGDGLVPGPERLAELAEVQVVVAAETLLADTEHPATVPGHGPLPAPEVRELASRARWRRLVADDTTGALVAYGAAAHPAARAPGPGSAGAARGDTADLRHDPRWRRLLTDPVEAVRLDHGTTRYLPPPALRRHVQTRDATCIGSACEHTARGTQLDHTTDYARPGPDGSPGTTSDTNLGSECRRVHNAKTFGGWRLAQPAPGTFTWTSPTGRTYTRTARPLVPGWSALRAQLGFRWGTAELQEPAPGGRGPTPTREPDP